MKTFAAGQAWDFQGRPSKCWMGSVEYEWDEQKKVFNVKTEQALGTGSVFNYYEEEKEVSTSEEIDKILNNMKELEAHYKKVYGE